MNPLYRMVAASVPASLAGTMSWFGTYTFVNAYLIKGLACTNQQWTRATLWYSGGMVFWYLICTEIASRVGRRWTVTLGLASTALGYALMAVCRDVAAIDALLALMGFATVANAVSWAPMIAESGGDRPGRALAINAFVGTAVGVLALLFGGRLIADGNYPRTFLTIACACAVSAIAFHVFAGPLERDARTKVVRMFAVSRADFVSTIRGPFLFVLLLGVCMDPFSFHTVNQLFPNLVRDLHGFREADTGLLVALGRIPALVSLYAVSRVIDRLNIVRWFGISLALDGIATILIAFASGKATVAAAYFGFYLVHGIVWGTVTASITLCLPLRVRDSGFAVTWLFEIFAVFGVGMIHNRLLGNGISLPSTFAACGMVLVMTGCALAWYSGTTHAARRPC